MIWLAFVVGLPALCATYANEKVWQARGPDGFKNPDGFRFPVGEVATFGGALVGVVLVLAVAAVIG